MTKRNVTSYIEHVRTAVASNIENDLQSVAHRMDHIERVLQTALQISQSYPQADREVLTLAVLLHDVDQPFTDKPAHVERSAAKAQDILRQVGYEVDKIDRVVLVIREHSTETVEELAPSSVEARILFDADKVDGLGATGIARVFGLFGQMGKCPLEAVDWYRRKIAIALCHLQTEEGKKIFNERLPYVERFLESIERENRT